jgi:hypothetical protein
MTSTLSAAIASISEDVWTPIRYPDAVWEDEQRLIADAEIAEAPFTAFTGRRAAEHVTARLIVRRVRRLSPTAAPARAVLGGQAAVTPKTAYGPVDTLRLLKLAKDSA